MAPPDRRRRSARGDRRSDRRDRRSDRQRGAAITRPAAATTADYATLRIYAATDDTVPDPDDEAGQALATAIAGIGDRHEPGLYGGAARVAFAVGHLSAGDDADTACEMIERSLLRYLAEPTESYDLISGLVGIAVPVLQRIADGKASPSSEPVARSILDQLERLARPMPTGLAWHTPPTLLPDVAARDRARRLLQPGPGARHPRRGRDPRALRRRRRRGPAGAGAARGRGGLPALGRVADPRRTLRGVATVPSAAMPRRAWRGATAISGVAVALMSAATATARDDWRADALELAHGMAARSFEPSQVIDAGLCHGAAGVAHLFNRLSQATGDAELARAADAWFARTLAMRRSDAIAGFPRGVPVSGTMTWERGRRPPDRRQRRRARATRGDLADRAGLGSAAARRSIAGIAPA